MGARPGPWNLLGRPEDPVPGDPDAVGDEADHYKDVAATIRSQAYRLRRMSEGDDDLEGHYADELKQGMGDLADDLDKIYDRFQVTGEQLAILEPELRTVRTRTKAALDDAIEEDESNKQKAAEDPDFDMPTPSFHERSDAQIACDRAVGDFSEVAESVARKIRSAADDDMKDSRWEKFKNFVTEHATIIRTIVKIIGAVVVVLAIVALFVTGLGPIILALLVTSLVLNVALASTGNGDWLSVGLDVLGIATLGLGSAAVSLARMARASSVVKAAKPAATAARSSAAARAAHNGGRGVRGFFSRNLSSASRAAGRSAYADEMASFAANNPFRAVPNSPFPSVREVVKAGNAETRALIDDVAQLGESTIRHRVAVTGAQGVAHLGNAGTAAGAYHTFVGF